MIQLGDVLGIQLALTTHLCYIYLFVFLGERCLPNNTDMYSLYSVNPNAQWIIKPRDCPDLN